MVIVCIRPIPDRKGWARDKRCRVLAGCYETVGPPPLSPDDDLAQRHARILAGFRHARSEARLDEWARYAKQFDFTDIQVDEQSDAYHGAMENFVEAQRPSATA